MKRSLLLMVLATLMLVSTPAARSSIIQFHANLSGPNESPVNASPGIGYGTFDFDTVLHTLMIKAEFSGLTGTTTASHIHCCTTSPFAGTTGVATMTPSFAGFPLGVTSGNFLQTYDLRLASFYNTPFLNANGGGTPPDPAVAEAFLLAGVVGGKAYFNIHTTAFPGGEIRGFLVPEPGTLALMMLGLFGMWRLILRRSTESTMRVQAGVQ